MRKKTYSFLLFFWFSLLPFQLFPQQGFYSVFENQQQMQLNPFDVIETPSGTFWIAAYNMAGHESVLLKVSPEGTFSFGTTIEENGMDTYIKHMFPMPDNNGNIVAFAVCRQVSEEASALLSLHFDQEMNLLHHRKQIFSFSEEPIQDFQVVCRENDYVAALSFLSEHYLIKISVEGEILAYSKCESSLSRINNIFRTCTDNNKTGMYAMVSKSSSEHMAVWVYDDFLHVCCDTIFVPWSHGDANLMLFSVGNSMILPYSDSGYFISSRLNEYSRVLLDRSTLLGKMDTNFNLQNNYSIIGHLNDTIDYPAMYRSIDFQRVSNNEPDVFHCTMTNPKPGWPYQSDLSYITITKTDSDLNFYWQKRMLTDGKSYSPFTIRTTSDGGCIVVGIVYDYNGNEQASLFALKINSEGTLDCDEVVMENIYPYSYYPNPAQNELHLHYSPDVTPTQIELYDLQGRLVRSQRNGLESLNLQGLAAGTYTMRVTLEGGKVFSDKVVKE